jgi:hypothetical protein
MGDRCHLEFWVLPNDLAKAQEITYDDHCENDGNWFSYEEINYGGEDLRTQLTEAGITFYGGHSPGDTYPECHFAAENGVQKYYDAIDGEPIVRLDTTGTLNPLALETVQGSIAFVNRVTELVKS